MVDSGAMKNIDVLDVVCVRCGKSFQCVGCGNSQPQPSCLCPTCFKRKNGHHTSYCFGKKNKKKALENSVK